MHVAGLTHELDQLMCSVQSHELCRVVKLICSDWLPAYTAHNLPVRHDRPVSTWEA